MIKSVGTLSLEWTRHQRVMRKAAHVFADILKEDDIKDRGLIVYTYEINVTNIGAYYRHKYTRHAHNINKSPNMSDDIQVYHLVPDEKKCTYQFERTQQQPLQKC